MKIRKLFLVPLLALGMLTSCGPDLPDIWTLEDVLQEASEFGAILVNGTTGVAYSDRSQDIKLPYGEYLIGARTRVVKNVLLDKEGEKTDITVAISYSVNDESADLWKITEKKPDASHDRLVPSFPRVGEPDYHSIVTATFTLFAEDGEEPLGDVELKVTWEVYHRPLAVPIIETTIGDMRRGITPVKVGEWVRLRGYITGHFDQGTNKDNQHVYAGTYIADGDRAIMLYAGQLSNLWYDGDTPLLKIGDLIEILGEYAPYNGLAEVKPNTVEIVEDSSILEPVDLVIDDPATQWNKTYLDGHDGRMTQFDNLIFKSADLKTVSEHGELKFTAQGTNVEVLIYVNYHIGTVEKQKIHNLVADWTVGVTKINFHGILSWYNSPQLSPTLASDITVVS